MHRNTMLVNAHSYLKFVKKWITAARPAARFVALAAVPLCLLLLPIDAGAAGFGGKALGVLGQAAGGGVTSLFKGLGEALGTTLGWILIIYALSSMLINLTVGIFLWLINMLIGISQYNQFLGAPIVTIGWAVTRDFANMFLVVALLVIAFATILNIHSYQASSLLKNFVLVALLVNFSKMICGLMIDLSQVVMMTFVSGYSETAAGNFIKMFQVGNWLKSAVSTPAEISAAQLNPKEVETLTKLSGDLFSSISGNVFIFIISIVGIIALLSMLSVLVARILTLWFLIVVSPLAFVAKVLPFTSKYAGTWWSTMSQQLIAGPIVAFIIWVTLASVAVSDEALDLTSMSAQGKEQLFSETAAAVSSSQVSKWSNLALYFVPIVLFILGAKWSVSMAGGLASSLSQATAGTVSGWARKGAKFVGKQALTGQVGIGTQTLKAMKGEKTMFNTAASFGLQKTGEKLERLGERAGEGGRISQFTAWSGRAIQKAQDATVGGRAQARIRYSGKTVKGTLTALGIGEQAKKNEEIEAADQDAAYIERRASNDYVKAQREVESLRAQAAGAADPTERAHLEQKARELQAEAINEKNATVQMAKVKRKSKVDEQKKKLEESGINQPDIIMNEMSRRVNSGENIPQIEIEAYKAAMDDALKKEEDQRLEREERDSGGGWSGEERSRRKAIIQNEQKQFTNTMQAALDTHRSENLEFATQAVQNQEKQFKSDHAQNQTLHATVIQTVSDTQRTVGAIRSAGKTPAQWNNADIDRVVSAIGNDLGRMVETSGRPNVARQQQALGEALRDIPDDRRVIVVNELARRVFPVVNDQDQSFGNQHLNAAVTNIMNYTPRPSDVVLNQIAASISARPDRDSGAFPGKFNESDIGMVRDPNGKWNMPPGGTQARDIERMVTQGIPGKPDAVAEFIANCNPELIKNPEFGRAIGKGIQGPDILRAVRNQLRAMNRSREERVEYMRALKEHAMKNAESTEIRNQISQVGLAEDEDIDPILRGDTLV